MVRENKTNKQTNREIKHTEGTGRASSLQRTSSPEKGSEEKSQPQIIQTYIQRQTRTTDDTEDKDKDKECATQRNTNKGGGKGGQQSNQIKE